MLCTTVAALLFPVAVMAFPAAKPANGVEVCLPVSYILTEYTIAKSPSYYFVSFNLQSSYTIDARVDDKVEDGANCEADGIEIHSGGNKCNIAGEKIDNLVFDLREGSGDPNYRIQHSWQCNNATWTSLNDIELPSLDCETTGNGKEGETTRCTSKPIIFIPQNGRKLSRDDKKKAAGKNEAAKPSASPTIKAADCPKCKISPSI
ncbi:hypothetical protein C7974DRAFT_323981 [Boeremia exigua]|uniref:uncharacterized protein n=1 Tax=Boeremia exigua TaxID=749465 RepID=UPI001E8EC071|nr:uncharacterized protein C7974DRAFT_323981 [Boeremia exigua]KAH6611963.1 hypothetical protein C7974DRAFT_323981 [Boeremia exigua]